ncbi:hypothetical protein M1295_00540 [Patescibacteria group bacterium]|nr:hypothetical protein [Patescibacteria group bacterium]
MAKYEAIKNNTAARAEENTKTILRRIAAAAPRVRIPRPIQPAKGTAQEALVLALADLHVGEAVKKEAMNGLNEYDVRICLRRLRFCIEETISFAKRNRTFNKIYVFLLGDIVSGDSHNDLKTTNKVNVIEQVETAVVALAKAIGELAQVFPAVEVVCVSGNHGRIGPQEYYKDREVLNWDHLTYKFLELLLAKQSNVRFDISSSLWTKVNVAGYDFVITHGDATSEQSPGTLYAFERSYGKLRDLAGRYDYLVAAHFHVRGTLQSGKGEKILVGSMKGGDEYSLHFGFYSEPSQTLFSIRPRYGKAWELTLRVKQADRKARYDGYTIRNMQPGDNR